MQSETSSPSSASEEPTVPKIENPRTMFAEFSEIPKGRVLIAKLKEVMPVGIYSINAPTKNNGCRVAVMVEATRLDDVGKIVLELGGKVGTTVAPGSKQQKAPRPAPQPEPAPTPSGNEGESEGEPQDMPAKKSTKKASAKGAAATKNKTVPRSTSKDSAGKTKCHAEGHGSYKDIKWHNEKWHNGKSV